MFSGGIIYVDSGWETKPETDPQTHAPASETIRIQTFSFSLSLALPGIQLS